MSFEIVKIKLNLVNTFIRKLSESTTQMDIKM